MDEVEANQLLEYIPQKERDSYDAADFAGPDRSFPITTQSQLDAAAHLIGHAADPAAVKRKAIAIAKRKGFTLPASWQDDDGKKEESAASVIQAQSKPRKKIATLRVCFLEYNARSLNGRIYPKATCDAIHASAIRKLSDSNGLPITVFVSHEAANGNANTELVGRAVKVWQEGTRFYADLDLADTRTAWDMLALAEGQYLRSESMRVLGVDLKHDRNYDLPLVVPQEGAENVELMGIDLTTRPGLIDSARILQTLYESAEAKTPYTESFALDTVLIEQKEEAPMSHLPLYLRVLLQEGLTPDRKAHQRIHDHLAGVLDATVKPIHGSESARFIAAVESELTEEGRAIAKQHAVRLAHAHAEAARQLGMDCESGYHGTLGIALDPDQDGIPDDEDPKDQSNQDTGDEDEEDDGESHQEREKVMTEQEMMEALKAKGFTIEAPKTAEERLQATIDAAIAEAERKFNEKLNALTESNNNNNTERKTQALSTVNESNTNELVEEDLYQEGDYLAGKLHPKNWKALSNPKVPWPKDVDPALALHELAPLLVHRMLSVEAEARGIEVTALVGPYEQL